MDNVLRAGLLAHSRTWDYLCKVGRALNLIDSALSAIPYVALSGGKDSLVCLDLARRVKPGIPAIWSDDELEYPEQETYIPDLCRQMGSRLYITSGYRSIHNGWFRPWSVHPYWREKPPGMIEDPRPIECLARDLGFGGVILGLRRQESSKRKIYLSKKHELYDVSYGMTLIHPIAGWTVYDVWAYIVSNNLYYNPVYDRLTEAGIELSKQRVGPLPLSNGWHLREAYPEMYRRLIARYGNRWS